MAPKPPLSKDDAKAAFKEAIDEWLDKQAARFGWFSLMFLGSALLALLLYLTLVSRGWKPPA